MPLLRDIARGLVCALYLLLPAHATAQAPAPPPLSAEDLRTVYTELVHTHDGFAYSLLVLRFTTEERARAAWEQLQKPPNHVQRLDRVYTGLKPWTARLFMLHPAVREKVVSLFEGERTGPVRVPQGWLIAELQAKRVEAAPAFEQVEKFIPGYVAAGNLPSADQLRDDPALRARGRANAIRTVDALNAAPDLDVNLRLSSHERLLSRAILQDRLDLVEALLRRGANPNLCARQFCPVQSAIYRGSRGAVDALLKAGADPNQHDEAIGVLEGPLSAAAFRGDLELAERLIAAGARVNGQGRGEPPLMAAASAANRPMAELLIARGADPFFRSERPPGRGPLDSAERGRNAEFAAWLRSTMRERAKASGHHGWSGWIEQDGRRQALDGAVVMLNRAPFRIVLRMKAGQIAYVAAALDRRLFEEFRSQPRDGALRSTYSISFEGEAQQFLTVFVPGDKADERWGVSQAWFRRPDHSRFASVAETPQGLEHVREIGELTLVGAEGRNSTVPIGDFPGAALYLVLGTRIPMTIADDEVHGAREVELRFR